MTPEKRQATRKRIGRLLYAEIGANNGSILLDISEQGCCFQSIAPVLDHQLNFAISVGDGRKVTGSAQVAWVDATRKIGGLHFLTDTVEFREHIRSWMEISEAPESRLRAGEQRDSEAKLRRKRLREEAWSPQPPLDAGRSATASAKIGQRPPASREASQNPCSSPNGSQLPEKVVLAAPPRDTAGARTATLSLGLAALFVSMVVGYHQEIGHLIMRLGAGMSGDARKLPEGTADQALGPSAPAEPSASNNSAPNEATPARAPESETISGKKQLTPVADEQSPATTPPAHRNAELAQDLPSLWTLVEGGDTQAELALADRYLYGEGVAQSCAQARVLLEAAVKRGSDEAKRKLEELPQAGCR